MKPQKGKSACYSGCSGILIMLVSVVFSKKLPGQKRRNDADGEEEERDDDDDDDDKNKF